MTLLQDLLLTSRTVYAQEREFLIAEMNREASNLAGMLRARPQDGELLERGRERDAYWRCFLRDLEDERQRRDNAIREFCKQADCRQIEAAAAA